MDAEETALRAVASPWAATPRGAEIGTFVHAVLERVDFTASDLVAAVTAAVLEEQRRRGTDIGSHERLSAGLLAALSTPLGPLAAGRSLRAFGRPTASTSSASSYHSPAATIRPATSSSPTSPGSSPPR